MTEQERDLLVFKKDGFKCKYCDFDGTTFKGWAFLEVDHFKPKRLDNCGDTHHLSNLVTSCCICNRMKGGAEFKDIPEAREKLQEMWAQMHVYWKKNVFSDSK